MIKRLTEILIRIPHRIHMSIYRKKKPWIAKGKYSLRYWIDPSSALEYHIVKYGILNDWIGTHLSELIPNDGIVFDVGAAFGDLTLPFAKAHVPNGVVFAFEPNTSQRIFLEKNLKLNKLKNVVIFPEALQDNKSVRSILLNIRETLDGDGLINKGLSSIEDIKLFTKSSIRVPATTLDQIVQSKKLKRVDFMKIDVEGAEFKVLKGAVKTIKKFAPIIEYEYSTAIDSLAQNHNSLESFRLLKKFNYVQYEIVNEKFLKKITIPRNIFGSNIICFPKNRIPLSQKYT